jgi:uncharacterized protein YabN with tetrapyrrole methylase and pyrophosphatase domain
MTQFAYLDRRPEDETTCFHALISLARFLRTPQGCPWDREHFTLEFSRFLREEADELVEAVENGDNAHAEEELGDCLFTLLAAAAAAEEEGRFNLEQAMRRSLDKMIRRHDHVFGNEKAATPEEAVAAWEKIKAEEKKRS